VGWIELAADLDQMQASVNSVGVCTDNQFISDREGSNHTSEPKHRLSPFFLFSCSKTAVYSHSAN
jgi:hypothetical protein